MARFRNREEAGQALADAVVALDLPAPVVLALPRGGVPVAAPVADRLGAALDLVMVRKIGMPGNPELAAGAVVDGPAPYTHFNRGIMASARLTEDDLAPTIAHELSVIAKRRAVYLQNRAPVALTGRDVVVVDDGIATGATMRVALMAVRDQAPNSVTVAVPVGAPDTARDFARLADHVICLLHPQPFFGVGQGYEDFGQTPDDEVVALLQGRDGTGKPERDKG
ncbi:phosphoribosyltransferase [Lutimaribacter saemankumensis]|uniref:Putative phosphoribosyl transferase n=1 Tax=Lutimaribacter saemankumensis TaxID=490829 RepID=A0A1G8GQ03_9RHOB|nr:phosphoribosyltransferase family protein [Lutimaribacter saemankumensis]SDH96437.1 putative phosphoribosyl transferase [Lutimaribacter saemankumensis]